VRVSLRAGLTGAFSLLAVTASVGLALPATGAQSPRAAAARPAPVAVSAPVAVPAAVTVPAAETVPSPPTGPVVALGDSYTAGALLPVDLAARPLGCLRSSKAYPVLVAAALGAPLTDAACASARVGNLASAQATSLGTNRPQLDALAPNDRLVLLTLGGNDLGFIRVLAECVKLSFTDPWGSPCAAHYTSGGTDQLAALIRAEAPRMAAGLAAIAARAPRARIVIVGYPDLFPLRGGCWPRVPITAGDISYLRGIEIKFNVMLAADAAAAGATFVDTYTPTIGHDFCQPESVRDVEGLIPGSLAEPFHPNLRGQAALAAAVLRALAAPST
jgi:lysophospholipase L1-like esterase